MSANSPLPLLIRPDLRRRLQQRYEEAQRLSSLSEPDFRKIHELLAECLHVDAGNTLYLDAIVANLRRRDAAKLKRSWVSRWFGGWQRGQVAKSDAQEVGKETTPQTGERSILRSAGDRLWENPTSATLLKSLAIAAGEAELDQVELRYWQLAAERATQDPETARGMALTLSRQGRFDEATAHWKRLLALSPKDEQAQAALEIMQPSELQSSDELLALKQAWMDEQGNKETGLHLAGALIAAGLFSDADTILADVQAAAGADLQVLEQREQLQLAKGIHRLSIARRWAALDSHAKSQKLVMQFAGEYQRLDIEIWNQRTDRMPKDWGVRLELARRLKQVGNFSGAIQRLEEAQRLKMNHPGAFLELGECWQHLRQFERALGMYEKAIAKAEMLSSNDEVLKLARYRAGVLGAALGQREFARHNFRAIVAADPLYKDTQERLDKLGLS